MTTNNKSLMDCLKQIRPIEAEIYAEVEKEAEQTNVPLEQLLIKQGVVSDTDMALATADYLDIHPIALANFTPDSSLIDLLAKERWKELKALPISKLGSRLTLAMADPFNIVARDIIASSTDMELVPVIALEKEIEEAIVLRAVLVVVQEMDQIGGDDLGLHALSIEVGHGVIPDWGLGICTGRQSQIPNHQ